MYYVRIYFHFEYFEHGAIISISRQQQVKKDKYKSYGLSKARTGVVDSCVGDTLSNNNTTLNTIIKSQLVL